MSENQQDKKDSINQCASSGPQCGVMCVRINGGNTEGSGGNGACTGVGYGGAGGSEYINVGFGGSSERLEKAILEYNHPDTGVADISKQANRQVPNPPELDEARAFLRRRADLLRAEYVDISFSQQMREMKHNNNLRAELQSLLSYLAFSATAIQEERRTLKAAIRDTWNLCDKSDDSESSKTHFKNLNELRDAARRYRRLDISLGRQIQLVKKIFKATSSL